MVLEKLTPVRKFPLKDRLVVCVIVSGVNSLYELSLVLINLTLSEKDIPILPILIPLRLRLGV